ncbi:MAG: hypothetical protein HKN78_01100 [Sphingomonadaceae bacterium]|nr:hypothetical protein [Sphingomonadaceae bacterium]
MAIHLRQVCLVAETLEPVVSDLETVFGLRRCYVDPDVGQFGLENTLLAIGSDFIEVVSPIREETAAGRYLERRGGDGGYMVIGQVASQAEQAACRQRAADNAVRVAWEYERPGYRIMQLHPGDMRAAFLEIDWEKRAEMDGFWPPAGGDQWKDNTTSGAVLRGVELQGPDPEALTCHWADIAGAKPEQGAECTRFALANADLRFVKDTDGRGPGLSGVDIAATDGAGMIERARQRGCRVDDRTIIIGGVRFALNG